VSGPAAPPGPPTGSPHTDQSLDQAVAAELVQLATRQFLHTGPVLALAVIPIAAAAWARAPHWLVVGWLLCEALVLVIRHICFKALPGMDCDDHQRLRLIQVLLAVYALSKAASVMFFPYMSDLGCTVVTLILMGLTTGAVGSSGGGFLPFYWVYAGPMVGGLMLGWYFLPTHGEDWWLGKAMVPLLALFILAILTLARDNFKAFKKTIAKRLEEIHLNGQLRAALDQAESANAAKTRFLASASHDLRQPLHSLSLFFATLRLQISSTENHALLDHIEQALSALQSQMSTLLDMSKLDAGLVTPEWQHFALRPLLDQLKSAYETVVSQRGVALHVNCPPDLSVHSDSEQLIRLLRNLVDNAVKYTSAGEVRIDAHQQGEQVCVRIRDSGCGIAPVHHSEVFEEFFQVDNPERDRNRGLGLGLSIVKRLARLLHIPLDLQSAPGAGTIVSLTMACGTHPAQAPKPTDLRDFQPSMPMCHVLVLDDEAAVRAGTAALLQRMGCEVSLAACVDEALAITQGRAPDLVLADLRLREQESGITAVQRLRQQHPNLPAIIITGDTAPDRLRQAQAAGLPVLHKPVAADALMRAIAGRLDSSD
jgi:signal transduction histidine kinase/CheY-like chemotaxis protein